MADKDEIRKKIKELLIKKDEVIFAYIHGSFESIYFRDVDVAVYVDECRTEDFLEYELKLSVEMEKEIGLPVDVRVLNSAPPGFRYRAIMGELLVDGDEDIRFEFIERTLMEYLDFKPVEERIIREILD